ILRHFGVEQRSSTGPNSIDGHRSVPSDFRPTHASRARIRNTEGGLRPNRGARVLTAPIDANRPKDRTLASFVHVTRSSARFAAGSGSNVELETSCGQASGTIRRLPPADARGKNAGLGET